MKRLLSVALLLVFCIGLFSGCAKDGQTILVDGFQMEIPAYFENKSNESYAKDYNFLYTYGGIGFLGIQEKRSDFPAGYENMDLEAYGKFVIYGNQLSCELIKKDGFYTFTYEKDAPEGNLTYIAIVLESESAFWTVQAYCLTDFYAENADFLWTTLKSAKCAK
jgi:hypothetical protein